MKRILIAGAGGQIGSELTVYLRKIYGPENVIAADLRECPQLAYDGPFEILNILDREAYAALESTFLYKRLPVVPGEAERLGEEVGRALKGIMK